MISFVACRLGRVVFLLMGVGGLCLIVILFLTGFRERFDRSAAFRTAVAGALGSGSSEITLGPSWTASWMESPLLEWAAELEPLGFRRIGAYGVPDWNGTEVYPLFSGLHNAFAVIYKIPRTPHVWFEFFSPTAAGALFVVSSSPLISGRPACHDVIRQNLWVTSPKLALGVFLRDRQRLAGGPAQVDESEFEPLLRTLARS